MAIILKNSSTPSKIPESSDLVLGELAINTADAKLYVKNVSGDVVGVGDGVSKQGDNMTGALFNTSQFRTTGFDTNNLGTNTGIGVEMYVSGGVGGVHSFDRTNTVWSELALSGDPVNLRHNNNTKLTVTSGGVDVTGTLTVNGAGINASTLGNVGPSGWLRSDVGDTYGGGILSIRGTAGATIENDDNTSRIEIYQPTAGSDATMSFHVASDYATYFGLQGSTNRFVTGGWSQGAVARQFCVSNTTMTGSIFATGNITAYYSDERLKEIEKPISGALDAINNWRAVHYTANDIAVGYGYDGSVKEIGLLTQDVEKSFPEVVVDAPISRKDEVAEDKDYKTLHYERIVPILVSAMQEMSDKIKELEKRIADSL